MEKEFHFGNRQKLYAMLENNSLLVLFAGTELRKSADAYYPFYADRNFLYLTGIRQKNYMIKYSSANQKNVKAGQLPFNICLIFVKS